MSNRKTCIRCARPIDEFAKICPFCNWDQTMVPPPPDEVSSAPVYVPPEQKPWRNKIIGVGAFVALVIIAFVVGTLIHGFEPSEIKAAQTKSGAPATPTTPAHRSNVTLVPINGDGGLTPIEQPITTAPATAPGQQPNDATALPADQYAAAEARAKAQHEAAEKTKSSMVDPRTLTGAASEQSQRTVAASAPAPSKPRVASNDSDNNPSAAKDVEGPPTTPTMRTSAYLQYKPLPHIPVDHDITARLSLTVDPDGHVTDIDVSETVPDMPKLIAAVQNWRFKPATENGQPVTSHVSVDITFRANE
jgi:TonB family protein